MRVLLLALLVALPAQAVEPDAVRFIKQHDASCKFVVQKICKSSRSPERCYEWHKEFAAKNGADSVELVGGGQQTDLYPSAVGSYSSSQTVMIADYYRCE